jgi:hypothetical protein
MMQRRVKLVIAGSLIANVAFIVGFAGNIAGYSDPWNIMLAFWNYLVNAFEYYLETPLPGADFLIPPLMKAFKVFLAFLVGAIILYIINKTLLENR